MMRITESLLRVHVSSFYFTVFLLKISVKETCSCFSGNIHLGRRLEACPMYTMNGTSLTYCTDACLHYTSCLAVNYLIKESYCEMLDTNKESKPIIKFNSVVGYMYVDVNDWIPLRKNNPCSRRPCASRQRCVPNEDTYLCQESAIPNLYEEKSHRRYTSHLSSAFAFNLDRPRMLSSDLCLMKYLVSGSCERVPASGLSQSSYTYALTAASYGRLSSKYGWCGGGFNREQHMQIRFQRLKYVKNIVTRGKGDANQWVKQFKLLYSTDCITFEYYRKGVKDVIFQGNTDRNTTVMNELRPPIKALCLRINPWAWEWQLCMRVDLLGCSAY